VRYEPARPGDVRASSLSSARIRRELGWTARHSLDDGLVRTVASVQAVAAAA
jgi:nucleoside-diphosphate-sugar epimerase